MSGKRFGWPQVVALLLLGAFALQALWIIHRTPLQGAGFGYARFGLFQITGRLQPGALSAPPVPAAIAAIPAIIARPFASSLPLEKWKWILRLPFVAIGWLLGASVWYVARRLYGNHGGYIALTLYCFSPATFFSWPGPSLTGSLGIFGTIFVAIATAHTLYAPVGGAIGELRSRWRRVILMGLAIALALGSGFWAISLVGLGLMFMLYLAPDRRLFSLGLVLTSCAVTVGLLVACYGFRLRAFTEAISQANWLPLEHGLVASEVLHADAARILRTENPVLLVIAAVALVTYFTWSRCRYFGNTAPLLSLLVLTALGLITFADAFVGPFPFRATPFLYVFIGGVFADLLESRWRNLFQWLLLGMLIAYAAVSVLAVVRMTSGTLS